MALPRSRLWLPHQPGFRLRSFSGVTLTGQAGGILDGRFCEVLYCIGNYKRIEFITVRDVVGQQLSACPNRLAVFVLKWMASGARPSSPAQKPGITL